MQASTVHVNVVPGGMPVVLHISQYDVGLREYIFTLYSTQGTWSAVAGATATLEATKPDGHAVIQNCTYNNDGTITYTLQDQLAAKVGRVWSKLVLRDTNDNAIATVAIMWIVDEAGVTDSAIVSDSDLSALQEFVTEFGSINAYKTALDSCLAAIGGTRVASTAAAMTDHDYVYVYTGSETGYINGSWYYWNGSAWAVGGTYQANYNLDTTLTQSGKAADAKAVGDGLAELKSEILSSSDMMSTDTFKRTGYFLNSSGGLTANASWTTFYMIPVKAPKIHVTGYFSKLSSGGKTNIWCYDENQGSLGALWGTNATADYNDTDVTLTEGTRYISISTGNTRVDKGHVFSNVVEELNVLEKKFEYIKGYTHYGTTWINKNYGFDGYVGTGTVITVRPISSTEQTVTALSVLGRTANGDDILLGRPKFGETLQIVTCEPYTQIMLTPSPYTQNITFTVEYAQISYEEKLWQTYQPFTDTVCKIFKKVVCCGDSYTSGYFKDSGGTAHATNEDYAWPHYMETLTGNTWVNCGKSGANVLTWQTESRGLPAAQTSGRSQAYIIGLGVNDGQTDTERYVPVGTSADIGTNAETYYGGLSKIIRELATISPNAHIFVNTNPNVAFPQYDYTDYNTAVRTIVATYTGTYNVHLIDLDAFRNLYLYSSIVNDIHSDHLTAIGYEQFAEIYAKILSNYIASKPDVFQDVALIPYD